MNKFSLLLASSIGLSLTAELPQDILTKEVVEYMSFADRCRLSRASQLTHTNTKPLLAKFTRDRNELVRILADFTSGLDSLDEHDIEQSRLDAASVKLRDFSSRYFAQLGLNLQTREMTSRFDFNCHTVPASLSELYLSKEIRWLMMKGGAVYIILTIDGARIAGIFEFADSGPLSGQIGRAYGFVCEGYVRMLILPASRYPVEKTIALSEQNLCLLHLLPTKPFLKFDGKVYKYSTKRAPARIHCLFQDQQEVEQGQSAPVAFLMSGAATIQGAIIKLGARNIPTLALPFAKDCGPKSVFLYSSLFVLMSHALHSYPICSGLLTWCYLLSMIKQFRFVVGNEVHCLLIDQIEWLLSAARDLLQ